MGLPTSKWGVCDTCQSGIETSVIKRGKILLCLMHARNEKAKQYMAKARERNLVRSLVSSDKNIEVKSGAELQRWFEDRRKEMRGVCENCGGKSCRDDDKYYKFSIAHLLPKSLFPSVATHNSNWLELCHFQNSCHAQMDNKMLDLIDMNCFDTVIKKFARIYPFIAQEERRRIPAVLMEYLKTEI